MFGFVPPNYLIVFGRSLLQNDAALQTAWNPVSSIQCQDLPEPYVSWPYRMDGFCIQMQTSKDSPLLWENG